MDIIKVDQLSVAARAGALDGALAYSSVYEQHRTLVSQTALSGLRGLEQLLSETGVYGQAMRTLQEASSKMEEANELALRDPFQSASSTLRDQHNTATLEGLRSQGRGYRSTAEGVQNWAQYALNNTDASKPERGLATNVKQTSDELRLATEYLVNQGDPSMARYHATNARSNALTLQQNLSQLMDQILRLNPVPWERYNQVQNVYTAASQVISHADTVLNFVNNSPIAVIRSQTPTVHDIGGGYSLATWGNSGYWTLTDSSGAGIIVRPDGGVDNLYGGAGWQVGSTSTFVLPNQTKITLTPGSPASLLVTRGVHAMTIENLRNGSNPVASNYTDLNGRDEDRGSNDGHILTLDGNAGTWRNNGNLLGDTGSREIIATSSIVNELRLDPTDVSISSEMQAFINDIGLSDYDYDGDGKLNNVELMTVASQVASYIQALQEAYEQALTRIAQANQALNDLNTLIEQLQAEHERGTESRQGDAANARSDLQVIERRLQEALATLRGINPGGTQADQGNVENSATQVLQQLTGITQNGGLPIVTSNLGTSTPSSVTTSTSQTSAGPTPGNGGTAPGPDPIGDSLRRAGRLLSGILGGGNLNMLEMPQRPPEGQTPPSTEATSTGTGQILSPLNGPQDAPLLQDLVSQLTELAGVQPLPGETISLNGQDVTAGLGLLLDVLAQLEVTPPSPQGTGPDQSAGTGLDGLQRLSSLLEQQSAPTLQTSPPTPFSPAQAQDILALLATVAGLGAASRESGPVASDTPVTGLSVGVGAPTSNSQTPTQPRSVQDLLQALAGGQPLSRTEEQLQLVLQGMAALGSAGAGQSGSTQGTRTPTPAELRLGLQVLLSGMIALGLQSPSRAQVQSSGGQQPPPSGGLIQGITGNTQTIRTITGNFQTDPELMRILQENLSRALQTQQRQLGQASVLFQQSQEIVQKFVNLIQEDDLVRELVQTDDLSDEQQTEFDNRMTELRKDWGVEWGNTTDNTPANQSQLVSKAVQSGMMV